MKRSLLLLGLLFGALFAHADEAPSPETVLANAAKSRVDYVRTVTDLQRFVPTLPTSAQVYGYLLILDRLKTLGDSLQVDSLGGSPLTELATQLTQQTTKWLRLDRDPPNVIEVFLRWSSDTTRFTAAQQQDSYLSLASTKDELLHWHASIRSVVDQVLALKAAPYVVQAYQELQGFTVRKLLALSDKLDPLAVQKLVEDARGVTALQDIADELQQRVLTASDSADIKWILQWDIALDRNLRKVTQTVPVTLRAAPGSIATDAITKLLTTEQAPDPSIAVQISRLLAPSQVTGLGEYLVGWYQQRLVPDGVADFLYELVGDLLKRYQELGLGDRALPLSNLYQRILLSRVWRNDNFEGTYEVTMDGYTNARLSIANTGASNFIAALKLYGDSGASGLVRLQYGFFHFAYNFRTQVYEGHHFAVDSPDYIPPTQRNQWMDFALSREGDTYVLKGTFTAGRHFHKFTAKRIEAYPDFPAAPRGGRVDSVTSIFTGYDGEVPVRLTLTQVGQRTTGTLTYGALFADLHMTFGYYNPNRNVVYVTSGELDSDRWTQVRGQISDDGQTFDGAFIIGGDGVRATLHLQRAE